MNIRRAIVSDRDRLLDIWLRSVRATHIFVTENDIQFMLPLVREYLAPENVELWVLCTETDSPIGFMGMTGIKMDSLFLAPEFLRRGGGKLLVCHAQSLHDELVVDVNEQNPAACRFYEACGFVTIGRSELDDAGRPFPLLHMRWTALK